MPLESDMPQHGRILVDWEIREYVQKYQMIDPFEDRLVRDGVISYGLSSMGYDIRVADDYKIFTNINTTVVDPKHFDQRSFIDFKGDSCIIPPNSFALGRSLEYFRMPRKVLGLCLGKCLVGETRVLDSSSGRLVSLKDCIDQQMRTIANWNGHHPHDDEVTHHWQRGPMPVYRLITRTGRAIEGTALHPFRVFSGWNALGDLQIGDRIAVPRKLPYFGQGPLNCAQATLLGLMISDGQCCTPGASPRYTFGDPVLHEALDQAARALGYYTKPVARFGRNITSREHRGGVMTPNGMYRWLESMGLAVTSRYKFVPQCVFEATKPVLAHFLRSLFSGDGSAYCSGNGVFLEFGTTSEQLARDVQHLLLRFGIVSFLDRKHSSQDYQSFRVAMTSKEEIVRFAKEIGFIQGSKKWKALEEILDYIQVSPQQKSNYDTLPPEAWPMLEQACRAAGKSMWRCGFKPSRSQSVPRRLVSRLARRLSDPLLGEYAASDILWDTVEKVDFVGVKPVYDLTLCGNPNFLANDFIVHNSTYARCGLIVNLTPIEAEWQGHLTIEISNTTPLPAKIYSNEGIAQVIFLESAQVCEVSYADRGGKYQFQRGITIPRV